MQFVIVSGLSGAGKSKAASDLEDFGFYCVETDATEVAADFPTVEALRQHLAAQIDRWALALEDGKLLAAVNQTLVSIDHPLTDGDEVAFFPPVTGG